MKFFFISKILCYLVFFLFLSSCTRGLRDQDFEPQLVSPVWFEGPERMASRDRNNMVPEHYFFDPVPAFDYDLFELSYVLKTPKDSSFSYQMDLVSGRLYRRFDYCSQDDVWGRKRRINKPEFNIGIVPRVLDQMGLPQSIVVFGDHEFHSEFSPSNPQVKRAKVVGAVVEEFCEHIKCHSNRDWAPRIVLIAVVPYDNRFSDVENLSDLKEKVSWERFKTFMENRQGRSLSSHIEKGALTWPSYRLLREYNAEDGMKRMLEVGHFFSFSQMSNLQRVCHQLYDHLWNGLDSIIQQEKMPSNEDLFAELLSESSDLVDDLELVKSVSFNGENESIDLVELDMSQDFSKYNFGSFFSSFAVDYGRTYRMCMRYVRPSNVKDDLKRHWTMSFVTAFFAMERLGYIYYCPSQAWVRNRPYSGGDTFFDYDSVMNSCSSRQLNPAFDLAVSHLNHLRNSNGRHFHYIRYDSMIGGSHDEIFSWVESTGKRFDCSRGQSRLPKWDFPPEMRWTPLYSSEEDIIMRSN